MNVCLSGNRVSPRLFGAGKALSLKRLWRRLPGEPRPSLPSLPIGFEGWGLCRHGATAHGRARLAHAHLSQRWRAHPCDRRPHRQD